MEGLKIIRFAVVGAGHIGKRHAEMVTRNADAELVALCDTKSQEECDAGKFLVPFYQDLNEMLDKEDFDVLCVATPNGLHAEHSLKALEASKHLVVEKPMALNKIGRAHV